MLLLIILLIFILGVPTVGWGYNDGAYRGYSFGLGGVVLLILLFLVFKHSTYLRW